MGHKGLGVSRRNFIARWLRKGATWHEIASALRWDIEVLRGCYEDESLSVERLNPHSDLGFLSQFIVESMPLGSKLAGLPPAIVMVN